MTPTAPPPRVLPAAVYDALAASVARYEGVGAGEFYTHLTPCCLYGHAGAFGNAPLDAAGLSIGMSDAIVRTINARLGIPDRNARVSWADYCLEGGIVRGGDA